MASTDIMTHLAATIRARRAATAAASYTKSLLDAGPETCAKKFGEEAVEAIIAGTAGDGTALKNEAADVLYHLLVLLEAHGVDFQDVARVLEARMSQSGHAEKASRSRS